MPSSIGWCHSPAGNSNGGGEIVDASSGTLVDSYSSTGEPAFSANAGYFPQSGTLSALNAANGQQLWTVNAGGPLQLANTNSGLAAAVQRAVERVADFRIGHALGSELRDRLLQPLVRAFTQVDATVRCGVRMNEGAAIPSGLDHGVPLEQTVRLRNGFQIECQIVRKLANGR
jgi:hypothetical protein